MTTGDPSKISNQEPSLRTDIQFGLLYAHSRVNANTKKHLESASFLYALVEILEENGVINIPQLDERKRIVAERLIQQFKQNGSGVMLQDPEYDKYAFELEVEIDCHNRVELCRAACCRLPFALSKQDIREGIVRWDLGQPYLIDQGADGYCNHMDRTSRGCTIHSNRPVPCRAFDCREDGRIWLDYENRIPNPDLKHPDWPKNLATSDQPGKEMAKAAREDRTTDE